MRIFYDNFYDVIYFILIPRRESLNIANDVSNVESVEIIDLEL
jgi:hypothetical protein